MSKHLSVAINGIEQKVILFSTMVEESVRDAVKAFTIHDDEVAKKVIDNDQVIDEQEVEIEEDCLKTLALHQPVAIDLRFIVAILKINSDLERVGDHAVSIAKRSLQISGNNFSKVENVFSYDEMIELVTSLLKKSIDSLIDQNLDLAKEVIAHEDDAPNMRQQMYSKFLQNIQEYPNLAEVSSAYMFVSRNLERIAEHAISIAEDVIYMLEGEIVRHQ